jgi:hypothetical protein
MAVLPTVVNVGVFLLVLWSYLKTSFTGIPGGDRYFPFTCPVVPFCPALFKLLCPCLVSLSSMCVRVRFSASGELVAEACHLGAAHPPGYPLFTMVVHLVVNAFEVHPYRFFFFYFHPSLLIYLLVPSVPRITLFYPRRLVVYFLLFIPSCQSLPFILTFCPFHTSNLSSFLSFPPPNADEQSCLESKRTQLRVWSNGSLLYFGICAVIFW